MQRLMIQSTFLYKLLGVLRENERICNPQVLGYVVCAVFCEVPLLSLSVPCSHEFTGVVGRNGKCVCGACCVRYSRTHSGVQSDEDGVVCERTPLSRYHACIQAKSLIFHLPSSIFHAR